jgi:hypothetical protein
MPQHVNGLGARKASAPATCCLSLPLAKSRRIIVLHYRSLTMRSLRAGLARLCGTALVVAAITGCQSNSERDLIARDRRMQEDQIYALQDYINQYQKLVCRYRSENAVLRRQLSEGYVSQPDKAEPAPRTPDRTPATRTGPQFQTPQPPSTRPKQQPAQPKVETPEVPPLETRTNTDSTTQDELLTSEKPAPADLTPRVLTASFDGPLRESAAAESTSESVPGEAASAAGAAPEQSSAASGPRKTDPSREVMLSGEVVANDAGGGPRLLIDIIPFDQAGHVEPLDGNLSLMLLAAGSDGPRQNLGRWDFGPDEVRAAIDSAATEPTMRFYIELPAGTPVGESTELWARLVPRGGSKLLAHANVDLTRPGIFSSRTDKIWPTEESVVATSYTAPAPPVADLAATLNEGNWAVAQPGKPANLPAAEQNLPASSGWRASSEPMPPIMASSTEANDHEAVEKPKQPARAPMASTNAAAKKPDWSPERLGKSSHRVTTRPLWSASR